MTPMILIGLVKDVERRVMNNLCGSVLTTEELVQICQEHNLSAMDLMDFCDYSNNEEFDCGGSWIANVVVK